MLCEIYDDNFQLQLSISHCQLNADGEKYTIISNFHQLFTYPHSQWMTLAAILKGKHSDLSSVPQALTPACISIFIHILFFHPVSIKELYMVLSKINISFCVPHPTPSHLLNVASPAILPFLFCLINCFPSLWIISISIPIICYFTHFTKENTHTHTHTHTHTQNPFLTPFPFSTIISPYRKAP